MRKTLQPKPRSRNIDVMNLRLAVYANGWTPMPCESKGYVLDDWNRIVINKDVIRGWDSYRKGAGSHLMGTGLRIEGPAFVVDLDIKQADVMNRVLDKIQAAYPEFYAGALWRNSGAISLALFGQVSEPVGGRHSITYGRRLADGTVVDKAHAETYGSKTNGKYFAGWGPHKVEGRFYQFEGPSPADTRLDALPVFPAGEVGKLIDLIEAELAACGLEPIAPRRDMLGLQVLYDLTPETEFVLADGSVVTCADLETMLEAGAESGIRGVMTLEDWAASETKEHCKAYVRKGAQRLAISDFFHDVQHYYVDEAPIEFVMSPEVVATLEALRDHARAAPEPETGQSSESVLPPRVPLRSLPRGDDGEANHAAAIEWLFFHIAHFPQAFRGNGGFISMHPDGEFQLPMTTKGLKEALQHYGYELVGSRGGRKWVNPVDTWMKTGGKIQVGGVRMRPELQRPLFDEGGLFYINRYFPPLHPSTGGSIDVFERRMVALIPNAAERAWVWNWLAAKVQHPEWRMIALAMIASKHGTGRGLLAETLQMALGERFVISLPYDNITGGSKFNAEVEGKLLVYVNEARHSDAHKYGARNAAREALKVFIEPNHRLPQRIEPKGVDAYYTRVAISTLVFANSIKAVPIDEEDRRAAVVMNGSQMSEQERAEYQAWMLDPANIGALWRALKAHRVERDRSVFDPYMSPHFVGRDMMIDANKSAIDRAWDAAVGRLREGAELYAMSQVTELAARIARSPHGDFDELIRTHTYEHGHRIGVKRPHEVNWRTRYGAGDDNRQPVFAFDSVSAIKWTHAETRSIKAELDKAQQVVDAPRAAVNKVLQFVLPKVDDDDS
jgi:hypothetical protein